MRIDFDSLNKDVKLPLHQQLSDLLRGAIRAGVYQPGDQIESQRTLVKHTRLSPPTVTRALRDLAKEGWIVRRTGSGTYVNERDLARTAGLNRIGVFYYDTTTPYFQRLYSGIQATAQTEGIELTTVPAGNEYREEDQAILKLEELGVDGIIAIPFGTDLMQRELFRLIRQGTPVISVGVLLPQIPCDTVGFDYTMCGQTIASHLLDLQHHRIAVVCPEYIYPDTSTLDLVNGLRQVCRARGVELPDHQVLQLPMMFNDNDDELQQQILRLFRKSHTAPTALVCSTDGLARYVYWVLSKAGLEIPRDVSITGGGDLPIASQLDPKLTTMAWPLERVGAMAVRMLLDRHIHPEQRTIHRLLDPSLVIRSSTCTAYTT